MNGACLAAGLVILLSACRPVFAQEASPSSSTEELTFDVAEFEKSPWSFDGYLQGDLAYARMDRSAAFYRIAFLGKEADADRLQGGGEIQARLSFQSGSFKASALGTLQQNHDGL